MAPCSSISVVLIRPVTPAAHDRWPKFDFADPMPQKPRRVVPDENASMSAEISIGSPSIVPVPCASTYPIDSTDTPAIACAALIAATCPRKLGAV